MKLESRAYGIISPEAAIWDDFVRGQARAHLLQLAAWGVLKSRFGWDARIVTLTRNDRIEAGALVLLKDLPLRLARMAYVPMGGYALDEDLYPQLWRAIRAETGASFLKLEPGFFQDDALPDFGSMGFLPSPQSIQPPRTIQIDISGDEESILKRMNQGTRRKIRKSHAGDLQFSEGGNDDLEAFGRLMRQTGDRNAFGVHSAAYYEAVFDLFVPQHGALLMARHQDKLLAAIMVFALGENAWYFYGASSREQSKLQASYGVQWRAIQWAKARGCRSYDMWGIPDYDEATLEAQFKTRRDGLWGVYGFKRGWGGEARRSGGAWDLPFNPLVYRAYRAALRLRPR